MMNNGDLLLILSGISIFIMIGLVIYGSSTLFEEHTAKLNKGSLFIIVLAFVLLFGVVYIDNNFIPVNTNVKVENINVNYSDTMIENTITVESIMLIFKKDVHLIKNDDFKKYGVHLDDKLNFPMIKIEDKEKFEEYLKSTLVDKTYKELYKGDNN